ncbi:MAG: polyphosphate--glucose phosphotransferase [Candidatus Promineifilaceae bacterium]
MKLLGIDIGGSGIKGALIDSEKGELISERFRLPTPDTHEIEDVMPVVADVINHFDYDGPVGVGFPAVVIDGKAVTDFVRVYEWEGFDIADDIQKRTGKTASIVNDADAAGIAEFRFGAGRDVQGTALLLTIGTGIGSALFVDGKLVPNTELGKIYLEDRKKVIELYLSDASRDRRDLKWKEWAKEFDEYLHYLEWLFSPNIFIIGGGASKKHAKYVPHLSTRAPVVPAELRNHAGIIGAAMAAIAP